MDGRYGVGEEGDGRRRGKEEGEDEEGEGEEEVQRGARFTAICWYSDHYYWSFCVSICLSLRLRRRVWR